MQTLEVESAIRTFLVNHFLFGHAEQLTDDSSLLGSVIDSTGLLDLVMFLQERFKITVEDDEMVPHNFDSLKSVVAYVGMKLQNPTEPAGSHKPSGV